MEEDVYEEAHVVPEGQADFHMDSNRGLSSPKDRIGGSALNRAQKTLTVNN